MTEVEKLQFFGLDDVAEFCGINRASLYYHTRRGHIRPYQMIGSSPMFIREDVERFRNQHYCQEGVTKEEIAKEYGVSISLVQGLASRGRLGVLPGKRGRASLHDKEEAEKVFAKYRERKAKREAMARLNSPCGKSDDEANAIQAA